MVWRCYQYSPSHARKCSECGKRGKHFYKPNRSSKIAVCPQCFGEKYPKKAAQSLQASMPTWALDQSRFKKWRNFYNLLESELEVKKCPECKKPLEKWVNDDDQQYEWYCLDEGCTHSQIPVEIDISDYVNEIRAHNPDDHRLPENNLPFADSLTRGDNE